MTKSTITRERAQQIFLGNGPELSASEERELARMALAAMDSSESVELPLDYLQGHKDGLEWASQLAEANHPETGDWLYDDPIELAKAIRKGPDMPPVQPVADSEPVAEITEDLGRLFVKIHYPTTLKAGDKLYRHAQPAPVVEREPIAWLNDAYLARGVVDGEVGSEDAGPGYIPVYREAGPQPAPVVPEEKPIPNTLSMYAVDAVAAIAEVKGWNACRAAMLAAAPQSPGSEPATVPGKWIPVSERMPENDGAYLCWDNRYVTTYAFIFGAWQANQFIAKNITHWMPLPAGPQEVR
ncbi:DUF551 domain-containing protein [Klebsiella pneumoniae]|uniref:DUF551 domain-containing protein n=1 Tax=Klebsiella pneumoniae TaxID=573 RepID=UPI0034583196